MMVVGRAAQRLPEVVGNIAGGGRNRRSKKLYAILETSKELAICPREHLVKEHNSEEEDWGVATSDAVSTQGFYQSLQRLSWVALKATQAVFYDFDKTDSFTLQPQG